MLIEMSYGGQIYDHLEVNWDYLVIILITKTYPLRHCQNNNTS